MKMLFFLLGFQGDSVCTLPVLQSHADWKLDGKLQTVHHSARVSVKQQHRSEPGPHRSEFAAEVHALPCCCLHLHYVIPFSAHLQHVTPFSACIMLQVVIC